MIKTLTSFATSGNEIAAKAIGNEIEKITKQKQTLEKELETCQNSKLIKLPSFEEFKTQSLITKALLSPEKISEKRRIITMFVKAVILDPLDKTVIVEYYENPLRTLLENNTKSSNPYETKKGSLLKTSIELVAGAGFEPTTFGL